LQGEAIEPDIKIFELETPVMLSVSGQ